MRLAAPKGLEVKVKRQCYETEHVGTKQNAMWTSEKTEVPLGHPGTNGQEAVRYRRLNSRATWGTDLGMPGAWASKALSTIDITPLGS